MGVNENVSDGEIHKMNKIIPTYSPIKKPIRSSRSVNKKVPTTITTRYKSGNHKDLKCPSLSFKSDNI